MPNNRVIYFGTILLVATVLLWIGAELTKRIEWLLPYFGAVAVVMIVAGFIHEAWKSRSIGLSHEPRPAARLKETVGPKVEP